MRKRFIFGICIMLLGLLCACGSTSEKIVETSAMMEKKSDTEYETMIEEEVDGAESVTETESQDGEAEVPLMVMVKGELYYATGRESELTGRCGTMDGNITSTVAEGETSTKDNQSNFGIGYGYQYVSEKTIEIPMNNI